MRVSRYGIGIAGVAAFALLLTACGSKPGSGPSAASNPPASSDTGSAPAGTGSGGPGSPASSGSGGSLDACMVLDTGGIDDKSFNESSYAGMTAANQANPNIKISYVPSSSSNDYTPNLDEEAGKKCDPIIAVGGLMADNVKAAAKANPSLHFAEVDNPSEAANMYGMQFNTAQGAFLGGYLAAGYTKTGVVATFGGAKIGPVTIYMDGFWEGAQYYNKVHHTSVQVLGWDEKSQGGGTFVPGNNPFGDENGGEQISDTFIQQKADIIFPVAGGSGLGAAVAAQKSNGKVNVIWVDTDGCVSDAQYCKYFITSVTKGLASAVQTYLGKAASGSYPTGSYIGTLANNGTGLAPYHDFANKVPQTLQTEVNQVKQQIIDGKIKITSPSQPKQ